MSVAADDSLIDCAETIADAADRIERAIARLAVMMSHAEPQPAELEAVREADGNPDEVDGSTTVGAMITQAFGAVPVDAGVPSWLDNPTGAAP